MFQQRDRSRASCAAANDRNTRAPVRPVAWPRFRAERPSAQCCNARPRPRRRHCGQHTAADSCRPAFHRPACRVHTRAKATGRPSISANKMSRRGSKSVDVRRSSSSPTPPCTKSSTPSAALLALHQIRQCEHSQIHHETTGKSAQSIDGASGRVDLISSHFQQHDWAPFLVTRYITHRPLRRPSARSSAGSDPALPPDHPAPR